MSRTTKRWTTRMNKSFYDAEPPSLLPRFARKAGIGGGQDLAALMQRYPTLLPPRAKRDALELGVGAGRVVAWLLKHRRKVGVTAIDQCRKNVQSVRRKYGRRATILQRNILKLDKLPLFDVVLWMFSGLAEIPVGDRIRAFRAIRKVLRPGGRLVVDMIVRPSRKHFKGFSGGYFEVKTRRGTLRLHVPTLAEIKHYAAAANLVFESGKRFESAPNVIRRLAIFRATGLVPAAAADAHVTVVTDGHADAQSHADVPFATGEREHR